MLVYVDDLLVTGEEESMKETKKQSCVALSTAESEYIAAAAAARELVNIKGVVSDFEVNCEPVPYCDNKSAILMSKSFEKSKRGKHIDIRNHFLKDLISKKVLRIDYVPAKETWSH